MECVCETQEVKNYIGEMVEEEVYAGVETTSTTLSAVASGKIRDGYDGVVVGIAVSFAEDVDAFLKVKGKQHYADGLNCAALTNVAQTAGVGDEVGLYVPVYEGEAWEFMFKATAGTPKVNWRLRLRLFKKE